MLLAAALALPAATSPLPARQADEPAQAKPAPPEETATARLQRALWVDPLGQGPESADAMAALRAEGPEAWCRGITTAADGLARAAEAAGAARLYLRAIGECDSPEAALAGLGGLADHVEFPCETAVPAVEVAGLGRVADEAGYRAAGGIATILMSCLGGGPPEDLLEEMTDFRLASLGDEASPLRSTFRRLLAADLMRRTGREKAEREHARRGVTELCSRSGTFEPLLATVASGPEAADLAPRLDAVGILGEAWRLQLPAALGPEERLCLLDLAAGLRQQHADHPGGLPGGLPAWLPELEVSLRQVAPPERG